MQLKKIIAYALTICLLVSTMVSPAYAADEVYSVTDDTSAISPVIYYTPDYYPGVVAEMRSSMIFANNRIAHGSFATMNYNPSIFYREGSVHTSLTNHTISFDSLSPYVTADQTDVSGVYSIPRTTLLQGNMMIVYLPSTSDAYFDFQSSNIAFDQQDANANTFYINGTLTFNLRNLWSLNGTYETTSFYLASDPLAVQLLIDGKAYGDIIDVTNYTSPFTALYNGGVPTNASVTFNNLKVYYQGDTPDMVGFRVYTGSAFTDGQYNYNSGGDFVGVDVTNTVTMRFSDLPDITFVQEGGDGYAGDLSGISGVLNTISSSISTLLNQFSFRDVFSLSDTGKINGSGGVKYFTTIVKDGFLGLRSLLADSSVYSLSAGGGVDGSGAQKSLFFVVREGLLGLRSLMVDSSGTSWLMDLYNTTFLPSGSAILNPDGSVYAIPSTMLFPRLIAYGFLGLRSLMVDSSGSSWLSQIYNSLGESAVASLSEDGSINRQGVYKDIFYIVRHGFLGLASLSRDAQSYVADTVFPWQSYNMDTHQLNAATNITGQNNLFFTAFQSMEDKLGRLAYVFGSDEDLQLKDEADPGTDAFRENFGGGLSLGQISDGADVVKGVNGLFDSGYSFGDAFTEIANEDGFLLWFSAETAAALDSTGSVMALDDSDPYNMQIYYDHIQTVKEKREAGDD